MPEGEEAAGQGLGLSELIDALRKEVESAQSKVTSRGKVPLFSIGEVEAEVQFVVEKKSAGKGGINYASPEEFVGH